MISLCNKIETFYDFVCTKTFMSFFKRISRTVLSAALLSTLIMGCSGPKVTHQTDDSITFTFASGRQGTEDVKDDAEAYCQKRGRNAELRGDKFCTADCLSCPLRCRATFVCR